MNHKTVSILNGQFDSLTFDETVEKSMELAAGGQRGYLCTVNCAILMMMRSDERLQRYVDEAALTVADGQPIVWASRLLRRPLPERVAGVELVEAYIARAADRGLGVYVLGATQEVLDAVVSKFTRKHPRLVISGSRNGYFNSGQAASVAADIRTSGAKILIIATGVPKQEYFIQDYWSELGVSFAVGVGGSFDVIANLRRRAPAWVQKIGMEWLYRMVQEPRRLFMRYLVTNTQFLFLFACQLVRRGLGRDPAPTHQAEQ